MVGKSRRATVAALTKNGVNVSFTPCFASLSFHSLRRRTIADMSTSSKVVVCTAVNLLRTMLSAIALRMPAMAIVSSIGPVAGRPTMPAPSAARGGRSDLAGLEVGDVGHHVVARDAAAQARALDPRRIDLVLLRQPADDRRVARVTVAMNLRRRRRGRCLRGHHGRGRRGRRGRRRGGRSGRSARAVLRGGGRLGGALRRGIGVGERLALLEEDGDLLADRHGARLDQDLAQPARARRGHLDRDLVGHDLDERLLFLDGVAHVLQPLADGPLDDGLAELRDDDRNRHGRSPRLGVSTPRPGAARRRSCPRWAGTRAPSWARTAWRARRARRPGRSARRGTRTRSR